MITDKTIIEEIIKLNGKMSQNNIAKKLGISQPTVKSILMKNNIEPINFTNRTINFNENYFETIDNEHKAYWLGFIMADGYIHLSNNKTSRTSKRLSINISIKDIEILNNFQKDINISKNCIKIYTPKGTYSSNQMCSITINSKILVNNLIKNGINFNKTGHEYIPNTIPNELIRHFIRGFLDGDGSISSRKNNKISLGFCSSSKIILEQTNYHFNNIGCTLRKINFDNKKNMYYLYYHSSFDLCKAYNYLYDNSTIYLKRKHDKYLSSLLS